MTFGNFLKIHPFWRAQASLKPKKQGSSSLVANLAPKGLLLGCLSFMQLRKVSGRIGASVQETLLQSAFSSDLTKMFGQSWLEA